MTKRTFQTLIEMLAFRASENPEKPAFVFEGKSFSYAELWREINRFASFISHKITGRSNRIVLVLPNGREFFIAFYGVQLAGGIPVPVFHASGPERIFSISALCDARSVVIPASFLSQLEDVRDQDRKRRIPVVTMDQYKSSSLDGKFPEISRNDIAFIQYTSGSTGNPKGVQLSHANIITNMEQMIAGMKITKKDIFVSWLPASHDMGLILMTMVPFYLGTKLFLLSTNLVNIRKWIEIIHRNKATFTAAPDFGYRMALLYIRNPEKVDLSSLRVALNAAEPVRAPTIHVFEKTFGVKNTMMPAYGLAEATVGVSSWPPGTRIKVDQRGFVSVGRGFPSVELKILHKKKFAEHGVVGEILVKSPANTCGYLNNPEENSRLFWRKDFIRTGDLGYYDKDGDFYIVGRKKNIIIQGGQNISPQEVEEGIDDLSFVRFSAAVGINRDLLEGEQVYVFAEVRAKESSPENELIAMTIEIVRKFESRLGFRPGRIYLVKPRSIPRTPNGKIMHSRLKSQYADGSLRRAGLILFPDY
jgi:acyl-CoA synthetase (AMP-forming)/AMP-acid ligase II